MIEDRRDLRGMILAAGYGTRLAPVTDHVPKPLLPVDGRALLDRIVDGFDRAGVGPVAINTHHLGERIADHVARRADHGRFTLFPEQEILGTGGALHGAREFLEVAPYFLLHNGDVFCDADLAALVENHSRSGALATLLLVDWPVVNSVVLTQDGRVTGIADRPAPTDSGRRLTYTGIGMFSRSLLADIGPGFSSLIDPLVRALECDPGSVRGFAPADFRWSDMGTLARYLKAQSASPVAPDPSTDGPGPRLERITGHGSDRRFWRLATDDWSSVAMVCPPADEEFDRFLAIAEFLGEHELGGPMVLSVAAADRTVLLEDLGSDSLYALVQREGFASEHVREVYRRSVDRLVEIQSATPAAKKECPSAVDRCLDDETLRWETDYFRKRFLSGHLGLEPETLETLEGEFGVLAESVSAQPRVLIHRDYQSQNILVATNEIRLVDFQGMRLGPVGYDLASLVFDPYVQMPDSFREELVTRFAAAASGVATREELLAMVAAAGLQRVMQALGAFGYLGHVKGKPGFLAFIPAGRKILRSILAGLGAKAADHSEPPALWAPAPMPVLEEILDSGRAPEEF